MDLRALKIMGMITRSGSPRSRPNNSVSGEDPEVQRLQSKLRGKISPRLLSWAGSDKGRLQALERRYDAAVLEGYQEGHAEGKESARIAAESTPGPNGSAIGGVPAGQQPRDESVLDPARRQALEFWDKMYETNGSQENTADQAEGGRQ